MDDCKFSESCADLKPVAWGQGGTFGYTENIQTLDISPLLQHFPIEKEEIAIINISM